MFPFEAENFTSDVRTILIRVIVARDLGKATEIRPRIDSQDLSKSDPWVVTVTVPSAGAVNPYQTVLPIGAPMHSRGSSGVSSVAPNVLRVSV